MVQQLSDQKSPAYVKVGSLPGLYRHSSSGRYYGSKKVQGKRRECSLRTHDRKIAERRLREWMRNLEVVRHELEKMTLRELIQQFVSLSQGKSDKTRATNRSIVRQLELSSPAGWKSKCARFAPRIWTSGSLSTRSG